MISEPEGLVADFEAFVRTERAALARLGHLLTGSAAAGEDLAQDALLSLHARWDDVLNPGAYARRAVVNRARSHHRRAGVARRHERTDPPAPALPPEIDETWRAVQRLKPDQRAVVVLRFYEDLAVDDIAAVLDKPSGTVKSLLHRALASLKEELS